MPGKDLTPEKFTSPKKKPQESFNEAMHKENSPRPVGKKKADEDGDHD